MARGSAGSRSTGRTPISGPLGQSNPINFGANAETGESGAGIGFGTNEEGDREITGEGSIGGEFGGGRNNSINPTGASPFSPSSPKPPRTSDLIDLTKDAVSDLGKKSPIRGGGGIGVEAGASPAGNLGITATIPIGVSPFQGRGGVIFDPETGEVSGGSIGGGVGFGPISITGDVGIDEGGCIQFVTIGIGPFSRTFQRNVCKPNDEPNRPSSPAPSPSPSPQGIGYPSGELPALDPRCTYHFFVLVKGKLTERFNWLYNTGFPAYANIWELTIQNQKDAVCYIESITIASNGNRTAVIGNNFFVDSSRFPEYERSQSWQLGGNICTPPVFQATYMPLYNQYYPDAKFEIYPLLLSCTYPTPWPPQLIRYVEDPKPSPLPNTPPRKRDKKMDDACCKFLAALIAAHGQNISNLLGQPVGILAKPIGKPKFPTQPLERVVTPKDPKNPRKTEKIEFSSYLDYIQYLLKQSIDLDVALDPQAVDLISEGTKMMNPLYERPSDITLKENREPNQDKKGNDRELKVGEKIFFPSMLAEQRYMFESIRRLEYLFPVGELADAQISKDLLMPGQKGELKIFNLIHAYEVLMQYLSAILGDPRETVYLKDSNPAKPGDQEIKLNHMSISHLLREMFKFVLDNEGDTDALMMMGLRDFRNNLANRVAITQIAEMVQALFEDSGMLEKQEYIKLNLEGDPYAGQWKAGKGFDPDPALDEDTEEATEKILQATLNNFEAKVKVSRRDPKDKNDVRDLIVALAKHIERQNAIPATEQAIQGKIESAEFGVALDMALIRQNVKAAQASSRPRTRKKKK